MTIPNFRRRALLAGAAACVALPAAAQKAGPRPVTVAQIIDTSAADGDVARDFAIGSRAAWQDINSRGGLRGRPVEHLVLEADGTSGALRQAWQAVRDNPACLVLSGSASDPLASQLVALARGDGTPMVHAAPWLQGASVDPGEHTFAIFAGRREQIGYALKSLSVGGMQEVGAVFASPRELQLYGDDVQRSAAALKLRLATWTGDGDLARLGQRLGPATPAVLLFIGGTPELVQLTQGLDRQSRQRYVVAMADVNLQTVAQMGGGRTTPVIATQAVPMVTAALPVVRRYREVLGRLFDEPPVALSLAGFIAAHYTFEVLGDMEGTPTRAAALAAFQRRRELDVGGFRVSFERNNRSAAFVTQSMLTADGRVVG